MTSVETIQSRKFKGVWIPAEIWLDNELSIQEVVLLAEIDSFSGPRGCFASNGYLGKRLRGLSPGRISQLISSLNEKGYLSYKETTNKATGEKQRVLKANRKKFKVSISSNPEEPVNDVKLPWDDEKLRKAWNTWKKYLLEAGKGIRGPIQEEHAVMSIKNVANNSEEAVERIFYSISRGYYVLYPKFDSKSGKESRTFTFPEYWDPAFEKSLAPERLSQWWKHLRSKGWKPVKENGQILKWIN